MNWLQQRSDHITDLVRPTEKAAGFGPAGVISANNPGGVALRLVREAAELLRSAEDHSVEVETRAKAFANRAVDELTEAKRQIDCLGADCDRLNALCIEAENRALAAEGALKESKARISAMEAELSKAEHRASKAEGLLKRVEDAIRSEILQPCRATSIPAAA